MIAESIRPKVVHFVQTDESGWNGYIRLGFKEWIRRMGSSYERDSNSDEEEILEKAFREAQPDESCIIQRKLRHPYADGTIPKWHDHPDCMSGPLKISEATKRGLMNPSGEYIYRVIRRYDEVVWEGGE